MNVLKWTVVALLLCCGQACSSENSGDPKNDDTDSETGTQDTETDTLPETGPVVLGSLPVDGEMGAGLLPYLEIEFDQPVPATQAIANAILYVGDQTEGMTINFSGCFQSPDKENCLSALLLDDALDGGEVSS